MPSAARVCSILGAMFAYTLFTITWLSWIIMLGGVAGMQAKCGGFLGRSVDVTFNGESYENFVEGCSTTNTTAFIWWTVWFEFFLLILLSVAECGRVRGLYLTKQIFIAMVSVCLMLAADRANVVIAQYDDVEGAGALRTSAQACMAGQVITIICNLILLLYFGGEITDMRRSAPDDGYGEAKGLASNVDVQLSGAGHNAYAIEFERLYQSGSASMVAPVAAPETRREQRAAAATAAALGADSWHA